MDPEALKQRRRDIAKANRDYLKNLSQEQRDELKQNRILDKQRREEEKAFKAAERHKKKMAKQELKILMFMKKSGVIYYHHGQEESIKESIIATIADVKETGEHNQYNNYVWNHYGEGNNRMSRSLMGNLWGGALGFETIYDVPLDGSHVFYITDSGQRGLGSFNYMSVKKVESTVTVPKVNPGAFPPQHI